VDGEWECLLGKRKEEKTIARLSSSLRPGMTFVDVGANIGHFALLAALLVGPSGRVLAFEPTPVVANRLRENIRLNALSNVTAVEKAISDRGGRALLYESCDDQEANSLFHQSSARDTVEVETATLDEELSKYDVGKVDLLKIDAEGSELAVLQGGSRTLTSGHRPAILLEINPVTLGMAGVEPEQVLNVLREYGYGWEVIEQFSWQGATVANIFATSAKGSPK
jgi:FkbM family methyltransferase